MKKFLIKKKKKWCPQMLKKVCATLKINRKQDHILIQGVKVDVN